MNKELFVSSTPHETKVGLVEDDLLAEIYLERENEYTLAGSIYKGRVTRVLPGMQSAFVDIGLERDAFLYVSDFMELEEHDEDLTDSVPANRGVQDLRPQPAAGAVSPSPEGAIEGDMRPKHPPHGQLKARKNPDSEMNTAAQRPRLPRTVSRHNPRLGRRRMAMTVGTGGDGGGAAADAGMAESGDPSAALTADPSEHPSEDPNEDRSSVFRGRRRVLPPARKVSEARRRGHRRGISRFCCRASRFRNTRALPSRRRRSQSLHQRANPTAAKNPR